MGKLVNNQDILILNKYKTLLCIPSESNKDEIINHIKSSEASEYSTRKAQSISTEAYGRVVVANPSDKVFRAIYELQKEENGYGIKQQPSIRQLKKLSPEKIHNWKLKRNFKIREKMGWNNK